MNSLILFFSVAVCLFAQSVLHGQTNGVKWSSFDMGFATPRSPTNAIKSAIGQAFTGRANNSTTLVRGGFLAGVEIIAGAGENVGQIPLNYELSQNYPNPFNPSTVIKYDIASASRVSLKLYDVLGREVRSLVDEEKAPGSYQIRFDASGLASGVYFYRLQAIGANKNAFVETKKLILLR